MGHWTLDDISWRNFDPERVEAGIVDAIKAASLVEYNSAEYAEYLGNVFYDDPDFCRAVNDWAVEEVQHGLALKRWAELADPAFDCETAFKRFTEGYQQVPLDTRSSVRGSRCGELVARCVVEVGTSSYYSALRDAVDEPVLKEICHRIAGDEFRHYKLFLDHMRRYQAHDKLGTLARLRIAFGRLAESEDDELAFAFHCGSGATHDYDRRRAVRAYERRALPLYRFGHVQRALRMVLKAAGLKPRGRLGRILVQIGWRLMQIRVRRLSRAEA
ncbi:MAG: ferritin-like domain-containing protein [Alphaproteobacteria bacterium]